jgi:putative peptidoglycan lipid II flippase
MRSSAVMAAGTAVSRMLGFVRAALLLGAVGAAQSADAFSVANTVPNALYILLAGGVLNAVLVPQITRAARRADGGQEYIDRLLTAAVAVLVVVTVLITLAAPLLIWLYSSSDWTPEQTALGVTFALWCLPQVLGYGVYTMLGQVLNARGSFGPFMWAPVVNNVVGIAGLVAFIVLYGRGEQPLDSWPTGKVVLLAGTATLGVWAQALVLIPFLKRAGISFRVRWGLRGFGLRTAGRVAGWTFAQVVVQQLGFIVISKVTTSAGAQMAAQRGATHDGNIGKAIYDNAFLLFMLPHSLVAVSLVTALFTRMSVSAADDRIDDVRADLSLGLRITGLATVLSAGAFIALGTDFTNAFFTLSETATTRNLAYVAIAMLIGLVPFSAQYLFQRAFYAFEDAKTPFLIQIPIVAIWSIGNVISLLALPPDRIVIGVGVSMSVANTVGAIISAVVLHRRLGSIDGGNVLRTHVRYLVAVVVAGAVAALLARGCHLVAGDSKSASLLAALVGGVAVVGVYVGLLRRMRVSELDDALGPLLRRRSHD